VKSELMSFSNSFIFIVNVLLFIKETPKISHFVICAFHLLIAKNRAF